MPATSKGILAVTGAISTLIVLGLVYAGSTAQRRHLLRKGQRVQGTVVTIDPAGDSSKAAPILRYQFTPIGCARVVEGECSIGVFAPYKPGDQAVVCYNRAHPTHSIILSPDGRPL